MRRPLPTHISTTAAAVRFAGCRLPSRIHNGLPVCLARTARCRCSTSCRNKAPLPSRSSNVPVRSSSPRPPVPNSACSASPTRRFMAGRQTRGTLNALPVVRPVALVPQLLRVSVHSPLVAMAAARFESPPLSAASSASNRPGDSSNASPASRPGKTSLPMARWPEQWPTHD